MPAATKVVDRDEYGASFELDDGSTQYLFGSHAHDLADEIEASAPPPVAAVAAPPPDRLAENKAQQVDQVFAPYQDKPAPFSGGVPDAVSGPYSGGAPQSIPVSEPNMSAAPPPAPPAPPRAPVGTVSIPLEAPDRPLPDLPIGGAGGPTPKGAPPGGVPYADEINAPVRVAGSPGVSRTQLARKSTQGVAIPTGETVETAGAVPRNDALEDALLETAVDERQVKDAIVARDIARAEMEAQAARGEAKRLELEHEKAVAEQNRIKRVAEEHVQMLRDFDSEMQERRPDPSRFFKERGTWASIGAVISMGLGGWAAGMTGGRNQAADLINAAVDRDVEAQRDEYLHNKDVRNSLVADLARVYGDVEVATEAAKSIQLRAAQQHAAELAALSRSQDTAQAFELWNVEFTRKLLEHEQSVYEKSLGNQTLRTQASIEYPRAASGGGTRAPTLKERAQRAKDAGELVKYEQESTGGGPRTSEQRKTEEFDEKSLQSLSERMQPIAKLAAANNAVVSKEYESAISASVVPDAVVGITPGKTAAKVSEQRRAWNAWMNARLHQQGGANITPGEFDRLRSGMENTLRTVESRKGAVADAVREVQEQKQAILSAYPPHVRAEWERRNKDVITEMDKNKPPEEKK